MKLLLSNVTRNWLYDIISIPTSLAFCLIWFSSSLANFFVSTIRFKVGTSSTSLSNVKTFSALSTKTVFKDARKAKSKIINY